MPKPLARHSPPRSWDDGAPDISIVHTVYATSSTSPPRDLSALRSPAFHPWRTIRRRNHRLLLLPQHREPRPFPKSLPQRPVVYSDVLAVNDHPVSPPPAPSLAPTRHFVPLSIADVESIPVLVLPRPVPLPYDPYYFTSGKCFPSGGCGSIWLICLNSSPLDSSGHIALPDHASSKRKILKIVTSRKTSSENCFFLLAYHTLYMSTLQLHLGDGKTSQPRHTTILHVRALRVITTAECEIIRVIKCYVALDYEQDLPTATQPAALVHCRAEQRLPPDRLSPPATSGSAPPKMSSSTFIGLEAPGIHNTIAHSGVMAALTRLERSLPGETFYGPVQSGLALVCAREYPWNEIARSTISEIAWGAHHPEEYNEHEEVLDLLPPDQLVFLMVLAEICHLEPDFTGFVEPAIADFVNAWLDHCRPPPPVPSVPTSVLSVVSPRMTSYGQVRSDLALACASQQPHAAFALSNVFELVFGPHTPPEDQDYLAQLPADQLVFLCTLVEFVALEPVFAEFLRPAILSFATGWVTHCRHQDSFA
ncbi:hypothetical protein C8J57DRAFT_1502470 [Mycena rebaudengoi]|nr:hypothetical protein C8J57DRAFT_1502470 [Mycena rebaudengoi]